MMIQAWSSAWRTLLRNGGLFLTAIWAILATVIVLLLFTFVGGSVEYGITGATAGTPVLRIPGQTIGELAAILVWLALLAFPLAGVLGSCASRVSPARVGARAFWTCAFSDCGRAWGAIGVLVLALVAPAIIFAILFSAQDLATPALTGIGSSMYARPLIIAYGAAGLVFLLESPFVSMAVGALFLDRQPWTRALAIGIRQGGRHWLPVLFAHLVVQVVDPVIAAALIWAARPFGPAPVLLITLVFLVLWVPYSNLLSFTMYRLAIPSKMVEEGPAAPPSGDLVASQP